MSIKGCLKVISYGGGVQSTAMIVLAIQGKIPDVDAALFSNVGDDSEHPATLDFVRNVATPYAAKHGLVIHELTPLRHKVETTLMREITKEDSKRDLIPVFGEAGNPMKRSCTADFKVATIHRWLKAHGARKYTPAYVQLGISTDEIQRAGRGKELLYERRQYPLLDLGLSRTDCIEIIKEAGLPVPPKSACFFCPFHGDKAWAELRRERPDLFEKAQDLEDFMQKRKETLGLRKVYLSRRGAEREKRLSETFLPAEEPVFGSQVGSDGCDSGFCWT